MNPDSAHWPRTERFERAVAVGSLDVRRVLFEAEWRKRHPSLWERFRSWIEGRL